MSEEIKFTYYLNGEIVKRESIKVILDKVYITSLIEGHLSTRHKARKEDLI